jgi:hypothetical protein
VAAAAAFSFRYKNGGGEDSKSGPYFSKLWAKIYRQQRRLYGGSVKVNFLVHMRVGKLLLKMQQSCPSMESENTIK